MKKGLNVTTLLCMFMLGVGHAEGTGYVLKDLGTLHTEKSTVGVINNQGHVTGKFKTQEKTTHFIWQQEKGLTPLDITAPSCRPPLINNLNQIVGTCWVFTDFWFFSNYGMKHLYTMGTDFILTDLKYPPHWKIQQLDILQWKMADIDKWNEHEFAAIGYNDLNQILVANACQGQEKLCQDKKGTQFAILENGVFQSLDSIVEKAYAINNKGIILGRKWLLHEGHNVPLLVLFDTTRGSLQQIIKDVELVVHDLNDLNQVIGVRKFTATQSKTEGFYWDDKLGFLMMGSFIPVAINNKGDIVGYKVLNDDTQVPALHRKGVVTDLNKLLDFEKSESAWVKITTVKDINDEGYIIGEGIYDDKIHGFILIPN